MKSFNHRKTVAFPSFPAYFFPACLSGFLLALAFPPVNFYPVAFLGMVPLLILLEKTDKKDRFFAGLFAGFCHYLALIHWFFTTMHTYGHLNSLVAISALILMCLYFALYFAFFALVLGFFDFNCLSMPLVAGGVWVLFEYIKSSIFSGFPWGNMGYSQYLNLFFVQAADITGVYGISFLIILINALAALVVINLKKDRKKVLISVIAIILVVTAVLSYGMIRIKTINRSIAGAPTRKIAVVQGNIRQDVKWDKNYVNETLNRYCFLSLKVSEKKPDLIAWPETALPFYYGASRALSDKVDACIRKAGTDFLIGSPALTLVDDRTEYYNRAYMFNRFSIETGKYDKVHLVPFGEYVPLGEYFSFLGKLTAQSGDFTRGASGTAPLKFGNTRVGVLICFEIIFPALSRDFVNKGADILLTITNDAWFGRSSAPEQNFSTAVFRAVENRRSLARAANTGISGFISPVGKIYEKSDIFVEAGLVHDLPILSQKTFYTKFGDIFAIFCCIAVMGGFVVNRVHNARQGN